MRGSRMISTKYLRTEERLAIFSEECSLRLQAPIEQLYKKFPEITNCTFKPEIRNGERFLPIRIEIFNTPKNFGRVVRSKGAIEEAVQFLSNFTMPSLDFESLSTPELVDNFVEERVMPQLKKFYDFYDVVRVSVITSARIVPQDRQFMKPVFRYKIRLPIEVELGAGERIVTTLSALKETTKTYLRQFNPFHEKYCEFMRLDGRRYPFPIQNLFFERMDDEHSRTRAHVTYTNRQEQTIDYLANQQRADIPSFRLPNSDRTYNLKRATHQFFYLWSADEHLQCGDRRTIHKFGITSIAMSELDLLSLEQAIRKRINGYVRDHSITVWGERIELISNPEPLNAGKNDLNRFESFLKNKDNNMLLCDVSKQEYSAPATEVMLSDYQNQVYVKQYIEKLASTYFPNIKFLEGIRTS
ncbi:hypothetical protein [Pseudidiomarina donghaiensis]|uniref:Uncharacterized protein n=1 Tax=Pseudidiomarina donghaiensis TaxID=519452 RepID=A0A432XJQ7_9GAMM|nr:hypothetical protein [Pseudidiomarina donghaiensis]RUO48945.1 hypothetical protein CWE24_00035 [Pseudidiomarina donghaiensis]SFV20264.1 hypothetical protein SAMN04488139_0133 [Pseudidiomarina donghaiensis]